MLDKYGVQYNEDKRAGKIGKSRPIKPAAEADTSKKDSNRRHKKNRGRNQHSQRQSPRPNAPAEAKKEQ